jgi:TerC family integral membrane protein
VSVPTSVLVWGVTAVCLAGVFVVDLRVIAHRREPVGVREASGWVGAYVGLAIAFAGFLLVARGQQSATQFVAGYVTEYSLSFDNLFVFTLIIRRFAVPALAVDRVLYIGIVLSLVLRGVLIAVGAVAVAAASWVFYPLGAFLILTAWRLVAGGEEADGDIADSRIVRLAARVVPVQAEYSGSRILYVRDGRRVLTPLAVVVVAIGIANLVFALDSIPAIFGLTHDGYVVFTANAFALMGLRQLYFLLEGLLDRLVHLDVGLALVLGFIGVKLLLEAIEGSHVHAVWGVGLPHIGSALSLAVVVSVLAATAVVSLVHSRGNASTLSDD